MEIIKRGEIPEEKVYLATCRNCKTEISFKRKEVTGVSYFWKNVMLHINCPVCYGEIDYDA